MPLFPKTVAASSIALALCLTACGGGGGGGGGGGLVSTPPPPSAPPPPPQSQAGTVGVPAAAVVGNAQPFPIATTGGATIQAHSSTVFPLLQSTLSINADGAVADSATMNGGSTLNFSSGGTSYQLNVGNPAVGVSNATLNLTSSGTYDASVSGGATAILQIANPATSGLVWTTYGFWAVETPTRARTETTFVTGYQTPLASVPTTGSATFQGSVVGEAFHPNASGINGLAYYALTGDAALQANFATGAMTGSLTNMITTGFDGDTSPWNSVSLVGAISGGNFSGSTAVTSVPANGGALAANATGTFAGLFFGPVAQELGAVWTLHDGRAGAFGSIAATTAPDSGDDNPWDY